jgi:hypothetical protein
MKPENRFIAAVHKELHPDIEREKMFNPMRGGTADCNYAGFADELWVEYKWHLAQAWRRLKPTLSPLQMNWLVKRYDRGREPWVVVGFPTGCIILRDPKAWKQGVARDEAQVLTKQELARRIETRCGLEHSAGQRSERSSSTP